MVRALLTHLARYATALVVASLAVFFILRIVPGDPAAIALGVNATPELLAAKRAELGTDKPLMIQYFQWIGGLLTGDFGVSLTTRMDLTPLILDRLKVSAILVICAMIVAVATAVPVGTWAAMRHAKADGVFITALSQIGIAIPSFLAGIVLVMLFSLKLRLLPANGWIAPASSTSGFLTHLVMPVLALAAVQGAILTRYVRSAVLAISGEDFLRTARSKGLSPWEAIIKHGLRNAALPVITVTGVQLTTLITGAVVIERVFSIPGIGSMLLDAVLGRDLPQVQTIVMVLVIVTLLVNFLVDVGYLLIDPRQRISRKVDG